MGQAVWDKPRGASVTGSLRLNWSESLAQERRKRLHWGVGGDGWCVDACRSIAAGTRSNEE